MNLRLDCTRMGHCRAPGNAVLRALKPLPCRRQGYVHGLFEQGQKYGLKPVAASVEMNVPDVKDESSITGMTDLLDSLKYNSDGLVAVIVQVGYALAFALKSCL